MRSVEECYRGSSVRVFRLDAEAVRRRLGDRARRLLAARSDVAEVTLFGSLARGEARPGSDADLFVVLRDTDLPFLSRSAEIARHFRGVGVGVDVLAYTVSELARLGDGAFVRTVRRQGIVLARRDEP